MFMNLLHFSSLYVDAYIGLDILTYTKELSCLNSFVFLSFLSPSLIFLHSCLGDTSACLEFS